MTSYGRSIDMSEPGTTQGIHFSAIVGSGGVTQGQPVVLTTTSKTVIASTTTSDIVIGLAATTQIEGDSVDVLCNGCLVLTPYTLTGAGKVGVGTSGTAGTLVNYSSGTIVGYVVTSATTASVVRVQIQY